MSGTGIVTFDYETWSLRFPEFSETVGDTLAQLYFTEAAIYLDNTAGSLVTDVNQRAVLLNLLVAHIASLNVGSNGNPASPLVGRITQATQGSVSVSTDNGSTSPNAAWYLQTKYGAQYWQMTAGYRTMRYYRGAPPAYDAGNRNRLFPWAGGRYPGY